MKTKISALIDGELDDHEMHEVCISMRHDEALRRTSCIYALISDTLRGEPHLASEITGAVLDHLADEPVVLAPQRFSNFWRDHREWHRPLMALAATLAGVAVVAWLGLTSPLAQKGNPMAEQKAVALAPINNADMQEYLIAHQLYSGSISLNGDAQRIRTVSLNGAQQRR
ncbi:MAG: RseA family anti-sigma factor [Georgfuchsia sp.]